MSKEELVALILGVLLLISPLAGGVIQNHFQAQEIQGWLTVVVGALTLAVLVFQSYVYLGQQRLMEGQLKATETAANTTFVQIRPWITVTMTFDGDIRIGQHHTDFNIGFDLENVGGSPAFSVGIDYEIRFQGLTTTPNVEESPFLFLRKRLNPITNFVWLAPGRVHGVHNVTRIISNNVIAAAINGPLSPQFFITVVGYASYRTGIDSEIIRETPFAFDLYRWVSANPAARTSFNLAPGQVFCQESLRVSEISPGNRRPT